MWVIVAKAEDMGDCCQGGGGGWWLPRRWIRVVVAKAEEVGGGCQGGGGGWWLPRRWRWMVVDVAIFGLDRLKLSRTLRVWESCIALVSVSKLRVRPSQFLAHTIVCKRNLVQNVLTLFAFPPDCC
jgi:hypothetical protein